MESSKASTVCTLTEIGGGGGGIKGKNGRGERKNRRVEWTHIYFNSTGSWGLTCDTVPIGHPDTHSSEAVWVKWPHTCGRPEDGPFWRLWDNCRVILKELEPVLKLVANAFLAVLTPARLHRKAHYLQDWHLVIKKV